MFSTLFKILAAIGQVKELAVFVMGLFKKKEVEPCQEPRPPVDKKAIEK